MVPNTAVRAQKQSEVQEAEPRRWLKRVAGLSDPSRLKAESQAILQQSDARAALRFGLGSRLVLQAEFARWLVWTELNYEPAKGSYDSFAWASWHKLVDAHVADFGPAKLQAEKEDEDERDAACSDPLSLCSYEARWRRQLTKLVRAQPKRWSIVDLPPDEIVDELMLKLVEAILQRQDLQSFVQPGKEWTFQYLRAQKDALRMRRQVYLVPRTKDVGILVEPVPTPEEMLSTEEIGLLFKRARELAESKLSKSQKKWVSALKMVLNGDGTGVFKSGQINHAELARLLDRDRSSAVRAIREIQRVFETERSAIMR